MPSTTFPNGQVLESSAKSPDDMLAIFQPLVTSMLGIQPSDPAADSAVRLEWQDDGQPGPSHDEDICYIRATEVDDDYAKIRDQVIANNNLQSVRQTFTYSRRWRIDFNLYGPNSYSRATTIIDALFLDWVLDSLAASSLALVSRVDRPVYFKELFQGKRWARTDFHADFYELVTASIIIPSIASAEVIIQTATGIQADITIPNN